MRVPSRPPAAWPCPRTKYADVGFQFANVTIHVEVLGEIRFASNGERICGEHKAYELCTAEEYTEWTKDRQGGQNCSCPQRIHNSQSVLTIFDGKKRPRFTRRPREPPMM